MRARAHLAVERHGDRHRLVDVRCEPPLTVRRCHDRILLVGSAAGPVGGDELTTTVHVGPNARAEVGSAAAMLVWPGARGESSSSNVCVDVAEGGRLVWRPEPLVSVRGSNHRATTSVRLAATATCVVVEEVALGRVGEPSGDLELTMRVEREGRPLAVHAERFAPDAPGAGSLVSVGAARHAICAAIVGPPTSPATSVRGDGALAAGLLPVADDASIVLAVGPTRPATWEVLESVAPALVDAIDSEA